MLQLASKFIASDSDRYRLFTTLVTPSSAQIIYRLYTMLKIFLLWYYLRSTSLLGEKNTEKYNYNIYKLILNIYRIIIIKS